MKKNTQQEKPTVTIERKEDIRWVLVERWGKPILIKIGDENTFEQYEVQKGQVVGEVWEWDPPGEFDGEYLAREILFAKVIYCETAPTVNEARDLLEVE